MKHVSINCNIGCGERVLKRRSPVLLFRIRQKASGAFGVVKTYCTSPRWSETKPSLTVTKPDAAHFPFSPKGGTSRDHQVA